MKEPEVFETDKYKISYISQRSPGRDDDNEDSLLIMEDGKSLIVAVADGLGGYADGQVASKLAMNNLEKEIKGKETKARKINHFRERILRAFDKTNNKLLGSKPTPSTTFSVAEIYDQTYRVYFSGDSEIFQVGSGGKLKYKTHPHNPTGLGLESGLMTDKEAFESDEKHLISNFVGMTEMKIEIGPVNSMDPRDIIILCSDGLTHNLRSHEICEIVKNGNGENILLTLLELTKKRMADDKAIFKQDDLTIVTILLKQS